MFGLNLILYYNKSNKRIRVCILRVRKYMVRRLWRNVMYNERLEVTFEVKSGRIAKTHAENDLYKLECAKIPIEKLLTV